MLCLKSTRAQQKHTHRRRERERDIKDDDVFIAIKYKYIIFSIFLFRADTDIRRRYRASIMRQFWLKFACHMVRSHSHHVIDYTNISILHERLEDEQPFCVYYVSFSSLSTKRRKMAKLYRQQEQQRLQHFFSIHRYWNRSFSLLFLLIACLLT